MDTVNQVVEDGHKLLQVLPDALGPSLQLSAKRFFQVVVTIEIQVPQ
jgi:hypothetical protein